MAANKPNKDCFIIMPITTPKDLVDKYSNDQDHFKHVLNHLFIPAVEKAGFKPVPPVAKGSDLIHAEIIKNIEKCQFVLCDMSILNPNVFFELGIRTALNKRVALVQDSATSKVPFDLGMINTFTYSHLLRPWTQDKEIEKLSEHLTACFVGGKDENSLWSYFSISAKATPLGSDSDEESRMDYLSQQISALRSEFRGSSNNILYPTGRTAKIFDPDIEELAVDRYAEALANKGGYTIHKIHQPADSEFLIEAPAMPPDDEVALEEFGKLIGVKIDFLI